jgi:monofunctional biosynthetic peptidoglycan transglycosylase
VCELGYGFGNTGKDKMTGQNRTGVLRWTLAALKGLWAAYQIALGAILVAVLIAGFTLWHAFHVGDILALRHRPPGTTAFIEAERAAHPAWKIRQTWVPLSSIPRPLRQMTLVAEDAKFYSHNGFDWEQIEFALVANRQRGKAFRGASTITQQLAKNLYLSGEKAYSRKLHEAALTFLIEQWLPKDRILEVYLNVAEFGPGVFGVAEGARYHFGKRLGDLTQNEMLSLVCLLPSPKRWSPQSSSRAYLSHKNRVVRNYGLLRGIASGADSLDGNAVEALDSLDKLLSEERWGPLRAGPELEEPEAAAGDDSGPEVPPLEDLAPNPVPEGGAGEGVLPE